MNGAGFDQLGVVMHFVFYLRDVLVAVNISNGEVTQKPPGFFKKFDQIF